MLSQSFINKYRPKNIDEIIGQGSALSTIKNGLRSKRLPQLICLTGETGIGKTSLAFSISRAINCKKFDIENLKLCGKCTCCIASDRNNTAFHFIPCSENGVSQDELRNYRNLASMSFVFYNYRVIFFDEIHEWYPDRQAKLTSFLDTISPNTFVICATYRPERLEEAFISRFQVVKLQIPEISEIKKLLMDILVKEGISLSNQMITKIAEENWSSPRAAVVALERAILNPVQS